MTTTTGITVDAAYRHCERVTGSQARNFAYGIRLLPPARRRALSAVYAMARRIDDIGDGSLSGEAKLRALADTRGALAAISASDDDPVLVALADAAKRFPIPLRCFDELIEGCEADVRGARYPDFDALLHYCRCVAGSIGRLSLGVFGAGDAARNQRAEPIADALGVALQLTNILRDVREDRANARIYLPAEDLQRYGVTLDTGPGGRITDPPAAVIRLVHFEAARAQTWYDRGLPLLAMLDRRGAACTGAMAGIYHRLLGAIAADPVAAFDHRLSISKRDKLGIALRALSGMAVS